MSDKLKIPRDDEDAVFKAWRDSRPPEEEPIPASVTFMEMMRAAAERAAPDEPTESDTPPATAPDAAPREKSRRKRVTPPLSSEDVSAAVRAAGDGKRVPSVAVSSPPTAPVVTPSVVQTTESKRATQDPPPLDEAVDTPLDFPSSPTLDAESALAAPHEDTAEQADHESPDAEPPASDAETIRRQQLRQRMIEQRRTRAKRRQRPTSAVGGFVRSVILVFAAAGLMATIFTWWTPPRFISADVSQQLSLGLDENNAAAPTVLPEPTAAQALGADGRSLRIGIVSGHRGNDSGAVCPDGLTEAEINFNVASLVVRDLRGLGYVVDLLDEFDARLENYQSVALVSIHANTCQDYGYPVTGFLISAAAARITTRSVDDLLVECVAREYETASGLLRRPGVTIDMTDYHAFREIHPQTPATILELGFMRSDREVLTENPELLARGIVNGVLCFVEPARDVLAPTSAPETTDSP